MRSIVLTRIDDRLIHGQVVTSWCKTTNANAILIVDDALTKDPFMQRLLIAASPPGVEVKVKTVEEAIAYLHEDGLADEKLIVLTKTPFPVEALIQHGIAIDRVNLGGMGIKEGRKRFNKNVSATPEEVDSMKRIIKAGVEIYYQLVPGERSVNIKKLLEN